MIVDIHAHTFPDRIAKMAVDKLKRASRTVPFSDGTAQGLIESMKRAGIEKSVVLPVATNPAKTRSMNDLSMEMNGKNGLIYFGAIHPDTPDAEDELKRLAHAGIAGVKIHPIYQGVDIDDPRYLRILEKAGELGLIVLMHAGADIGFPGVIRCSPPMIRRAIAQVGPVDMICAHMGGWRCWEEAAEHLLPTNVLLDTAFSLGSFTPLEEGDYTEEERRMLDAETFVRLVRAFGSRRVLFGSDSPWSDQKESVEKILTLPLTQEEKVDILGGNARRILAV